MKWINAETNPIPRDGKEYLTRNGKQGGVFMLVYWCQINNIFKTKGEPIFGKNAGTHWIEIPEFEKE